MHKLVIALGGILVLAVANIGIWQKQQIVDSGRVVLLELAPVDPRSIMQGDYMALRFKVMNDAFAGREFTRRDGDSVPDGRIVLSLDERGVGTFVRLDDGSQIGDREVAIKYRVRDGIPRFATNAFFFQEGAADLYAQARFGELRASSGGDVILTRLRSDKLEPLGKSPN